MSILYSSLFLLIKLSLILARQRDVIGSGVSVGCSWGPTDRGPAGPEGPDLYFSEFRGRDDALENGRSILDIVWTRINSW